MKRLRILLVLLLSSVVFTACGSNTPKDGVTQQKVEAYTELTGEKLGNKVEKEESFILFAHSVTCPPCLEFMPQLEEYLIMNNLGIASIETDEYGFDLHTLVGDDFQYTPTILVFEKGKVVETFVGMLEAKELDAMMEKYSHL